MAPPPGGEPAAGPERRVTEEGAVRRLVAVSAAMGAGDEEALREALDAAARAGLRRRVEEALLQAYLFVGFPTVISAFRAWRERAPGVAPGDDGDPGPDAAAVWRRRGEVTCRRVYGETYGALRENVAALHPALERWMILEGYGKVLARPGLDLVARELCVVALLAAAGREPQLHSHLRGALRVGAGEEEVTRALEAGLAAAGGPGGWAREARELWDRIRRRGR